jgi:hypothetical protein
LKTGAFALTRDLFLRVNDEKNLKKLALVCPIGYYWSQYLPNSGIQRLLVKLWTSSIRQYAWYRTGAPLWPSKWPAKLVHFIVIIVLFAVALVATGAIRSK